MFRLIRLIVKTAINQSIYSFFLTKFNFLGDDFVGITALKILHLRP